MKNEPTEEQLIRRADVKRRQDARKRKFRFVVIPMFVVILGVPIGLVSTCVYHARNESEPQTHEQARCTAKGYVCDRDGDLLNSPDYVKSR